MLVMVVCRGWWYWCGEDGSAGVAGIVVLVWLDGGAGVAGICGGGGDLKMAKLHFPSW